MYSVFMVPFALVGQPKEALVDIGSRIRAARKAMGLSQDALARRTGMSVTGIARIEQGGITDPHYSTLIAVAQALGISVGELLGETQVPLGQAPPESGEAEEERRVEGVFGIANRALEEQERLDAQAFARARAKGGAEMTLGTRPENEAFDRLRKMPSHVLAEAYIDAVKELRGARQEIETLGREVEALRDRLLRIEEGRVQV